jgi:hypothetical protein
MTSLSSDLKHKQPEHDAIASDVQRWLDAGHVVELLGNTDFSREGQQFRYNNRRESK